MRLVRQSRAKTESANGFAFRWTFFFSLMLALASCSPLRENYPKSVTFALSDTASTYLARRAQALGAPSDGRSGIYLVSDGPEALALRLLLADKAERTIDAQYYLLHDDASGHLFGWKLLQAAERGVRVRLLLDDMDVSGYDALLAALDLHPNIEIRLFNPFRRGIGKNLAALLEFDRVNRRMHNKSMTFDNVVTLAGGRNIGNEYFAAHEDSNYNDLDVLGVGPIAKEISSTFDDYWNGPSAVPVRAAVGGRRAKISLQEARTRLLDLAAEARSTPYGLALTHAIRAAVNRNQINFEWVQAHLVADPAEKTVGGAASAGIVAARLSPYVRSAKRELFLSSAYFVPTARGVAFLSELVDRGVKVSILTNSLDSTDVVPVYGHYALSRKKLLSAGVELWELRPDSARADREHMGLSRSKSSLHTKAFAIDERYLFVGSFNWDPRSVWINNEMVILIDSAAITKAATSAFQRRLPSDAYQLVLDETGGIDWLERRKDGQVLLYRREPASSGWRLFIGRLYGLLPIGSQL